MRKHFEGRRTRPPPLFTVPNELSLQNVPVERFGRKNFLRGFVNYAQTKYLFRQTKSSFRGKVRLSNLNIVIFLPHLFKHIITVNALVFTYFTYRNKKLTAYVGGIHCG